jgi:hypothetical protein
MKHLKKACATYSLLFILDMCVCVFLSHVSVLQVIYIQAFILVILMGKLMRKVFFGQLRAAEFEVLYLSQSSY